MRVGGESELEHVRVELVPVRDGVVASEALEQEREGVAVRPDAAREHLRVDRHRGPRLAADGVASYQAVPVGGFGSGDQVEQEAGVGHVAEARGAAAGEQPPLHERGAGESAADHEGVDMLEFFHGPAGVQQRV